MKKIFFGLLVVLGACSNKYESIVLSAPQPFLSFSKDTVRVREKDYTNVRFSGKGLVTVYCPDPGHELNLMMEDTSSRVHVMYRGVEIKSGESLPVMDSVVLFVSADTAGLYAIDFTLRDRLGRSARKTIIVLASSNQAPVASFFFVGLGQAQLQSWPYVFDASLSDPSDGVIIAYHYSVGGQVIKTNLPVMHYTFHAKGEHVIGLFVTDDLGRNSETVYQKILIP